MSDATASVREFNSPKWSVSRSSDIDIGSGLRGRVTQKFFGDIETR